MKNHIADHRLSAAASRDALTIIDELARLLGMPDASPEDVRARLRGLLAPVDVEAEVGQEARGLATRLGCYPEPIEAHVRPLVERCARLQREVERLSGVARRKTDTIDRMAETLRDAGAEIARLKSLAGVRGDIEMARMELASLRVSVAEESRPAPLAEAEAWARVAKVGEDAAKVLWCEGHKNLAATLRAALAAVESRPVPAGEVTDPTKHPGGEDCGDPCQYCVAERARRVQPLAPERARKWTPPKSFQGIIDDGLMPGGAWEIPHDHPSRRTFAATPEHGAQPLTEAEARAFFQAMTAEQRHMMFCVLLSVSGEASGAIPSEVRPGGMPTTAEMLKIAEAHGHRFDPATGRWTQPVEHPRDHAEDAPASVDPRDLPRWPACVDCATEPETPRTEAVSEAGTCARCGNGGVMYAPPERLCVAVLVTDAAGRVLLVRHRRRAWELPGGGVHEGEKPMDAAIREVREETGIEVSFIGGSKKIWGTPSATYRSAIFTYVARGEGEPKAGDDAEDAGWWPWTSVVALHEQGRLSDLASRDMLIEWAKGMQGA